jgi:flagellar basal-body rod modification protein FlgD
VELGAQSTGRHGFEWPAASIPDGSNYHFRVTATKGAAAVQTTLLSRDRVNAVSTDGDTLTLELQRSGSTPYSQVKSIN